MGRNTTHFTCYDIDFTLSQGVYTMKAEGLYLSYINLSLLPQVVHLPYPDIIICQSRCECFYGYIVTNVAAAQALLQYDDLYIHLSGFHAYPVDTTVANC